MSNNSWASLAIAKLQSNLPTTVQPFGNSMLPLIKSGAMVTLFLFAENLEPQKGDIVLVNVGRTVYLHLIKNIDKDKFLIGNNRGGINGWVTKDKIYGKVVLVED